MTIFSASTRCVLVLIAMSVTVMGCRPDRVEDVQEMERSEPFALDTHLVHHDEQPVAEPPVVSEEPAATTAAPPAPPASQQVEQSSATSLSELLTAYLAIGDLLATDTAAGTASRARSLSQAARQLPGAANQSDVQIVRSRADRIASSTELDAIRLHYAYLSDALDRILRATDTPADMPLHYFQCGMFTDAPRAGVWLQRSATPRNPYFGSAMLTCASHQEPL